MTGSLRSFARCCRTEPISAALIAVLIAALALSCASGVKHSGSFAATWTDAGGAHGRVKGEWMGDTRTDGVLSIEFGGEKFRGWYAQIRAKGSPNITAVYEGWELPIYAIHDWGPGWQDFEPVDYATFVRVHSGSVLATLAGSRGRAIRCHLQALQPERGVFARVQGRCQISDGGRLDVTK